MTGRSYRDAYTLGEAAEACLVTKGDVKDIAVQGKTRLHVWIPLMIVEESYEVQNGNKVLFEAKEHPHEGYLPLYPSDIRKLIKYESVNIRCFPGATGTAKILLRHGTPDVEVYRKDIRILKPDLIDLQSFLGVRSDQDVKVKVICSLGQLIDKKDRAMERQKRKRATYDPLFQSVSFKGLNFSFGGIQAEVIKQLHEAGKTGHPRVHFKHLLQNANSESMYMRDIFRSQPHWKDLVLSDKNGFYWLHEDFFAEA